DGLWTQAGTVRNWYCIQCERAVSSYDQPHRFVFNGSYELPIGRGHMLANANKFVQAAVGGWQMNTIITMAVGLPSTTGASRLLLRRFAVPQPERPAREPRQRPVGQQMVQHGGLQRGRAVHIWKSRPHARCGARLERPQRRLLALQELQTSGAPDRRVPRRSLQSHQHPDFQLTEPPVSIRPVPSSVPPATHAPPAPRRL